MKRNQFLKILTYAVFVIVGGVSSSLSAATTFQNNDTFCQTINVLCSSSKDPQKCADLLKFPANSSLSVSCKDSTHDVDFNGDGYADCVVGTVRDTGFEQVSVLLNLGSQLNDCSSATPKIFQDSQDYILTDLIGKNNFTNVVTSLSDGSPRSEISFIAQKTDENDIHFVSTLLSQTPLGADGETLLTSDNQLNSNQPILPLNHSNESVISLECNPKNPHPVIAYVTKNSLTHTFNLNYFQKDKPQEITSIETNIPFTANEDRVFESGYLASADFDQDGRLDIVLGVNGAPAENSPDNRSQFMVFLQKNDCSFTPKNTQLVSIPGSNIAAIKAGDFDGDTKQDVVLYLNKAGGRPFLLIFSGDNAGTFKNPPKQILPFEDTGSPFITAKGMAVGCFDNDDKTDIVLSSRELSFKTFVFLLNSSDQYASTALGGTLSSPIGEFLAGIESVNLDRTGGDDLVYLESAGGVSQLKVWMNEVEKATVSVGPDRNVNLEEEIQLVGDCVGANGTLPPKSYKWTITPSRLVDLKNEGTLIPTVKLHQEGIYKVTLTCEYRCGEVKSASLLLKTPDPTKGGQDPGKDPGTDNFPGCGDGVVQSQSPLNEQCDPPNGTTCDQKCQLISPAVAPRCGDGVVNQNNEICDNGDMNNGKPGNFCNANCLPVRDPVTGKIIPECGNGVVESSNNEQCDTGTHRRTPTCSEDCQLITGDLLPVPAEITPISNLVVEGSGGCSLGSLVTENGNRLVLLFSILPGLFFTLARSMRKDKR